MTSAPAVLRVRVSAGYGAAETLTDICFDLHQGERVGIVGTSGAGKSTLVQALLGLQPWRNGWARGQVMMDDADLLTLPERELRRLRGRRVALVPQSPLTSLNPALTIQQHFQECWRAHRATAAEPMRRRIDELMCSVHLPPTEEFLRRRPASISIGQAQRVLIALALLHRPALLIADEPTSALDACTGEEILKLFHDVTADGATSLLYVSHDLVSVFRLCDRMLIISKGELVDDIELSSATFQQAHAATRALLQTLPVSPEVLRQHLAHRRRDGAAVQEYSSRPAAV